MQEQVSLAPYTTLCIGGPARFFCEVQSEAGVAEAAQFARDRDLPLFILGGGSNLLVSDQGFDGIVMRVAMPVPKREHKKHESLLLEVGAGENWDDVVL